MWKKNMNNKRQWQLNRTHTFTQNESERMKGK